MRSALLVLVLLAATTRLEAQEPGAARTPQTATGQIEALLRDGWEVVSFVAASDIRTLVLLRHKQATWLVRARC
jgi:hypothetical protein